MPNHFNEFQQIDFFSNAQPGQIWQVDRTIKSPLQNFSHTHYSETAQQFLRGQSPDRYIMIVRTPEPFLEDEWQEIIVMVLSDETSFVSQVDVLIPAALSGLEQDVLAETWHVLPMLHCNLFRPVGHRLSRAIYDCLLNVGDAYQGLIEFVPEPLEAIGLRASLRLPSQAFHDQEQSWSEVLRFPAIDYRTYTETLMQAESAIDKTLEVERVLYQLTTTPITSARTALRRWFQEQAQAGWLTVEELVNTGVLSLGNPMLQGVRTPIDPSQPLSEISAVLEQLSQEPDPARQRMLIRQLGDIAQGNVAAIEVLMEILRSTTDDETLWTAVECLWQIDPGNPAEGVRRVKLIDLGMQVNRKTVALAIAIVQKQNQQVGVMLRVYPTGDDPYVPEGLKLILIDNPQQIYEVVARRTDLYIQLKFNAQVGETFSVRVALGETGITENFVL